MPSAETGSSWHQALGHHVGVRDGKGLLQGVFRLLRMQPGGHRRRLERRLRGSRTGSQEEAWENPQGVSLGSVAPDRSSQTPSHAPSSIPRGLSSVPNPWWQMEQASLNPNDHKLDEELCQTLTQRYVSIMNRLQSLGYNGRVHPALTEQLVNAYGILRERPELAASEGGSYTVEFLQHVLVETVHPNMLTDALLLLSCLSQLAHDDGKPMFIW
ncbi:Speriolin [Pteropus alecto]|uniref:Speriolin n=1 Tax=Pteropus alecto TaxID=9402 RepID=L5KMB4_PTEAL|nr:Speriolin [Pteropus alecto]